MTAQDWKVNKVKHDEIIRHLNEFHSVDFSDRRALTEDEFLTEHFPELIKDLEDKDYGYLTKDRKKNIEKANNIIKNALKLCEEKQIPVIRVFDWNENNLPEWRICKPTQEQILYLKFKKWLAIIEGLANKTLLQGNLIEEQSIDEVLKDIKSTILEGQNKRKKKLLMVGQ